MAPGFSKDDNRESHYGQQPSYRPLASEAFGPKEPNIVKKQPIAVVGFSLKFPQDATSTESFWSMMMEGRCATTEIPSDRMALDSFYSADASRRDTIPFRGGHYLREDIGAFDAPFFSITPTEAADMDPMQRGLLETTYRALENAGIPLESVMGSKTSVHTGCFTNDYQTLLCKDPQTPPRYAATGVATTMLANRISWFYNFRGASVNLDSACSSSMMAFDLACQGLWNGDSTMGIVAGCNLMYSIDTLSTLSNMNFLSRDSRCYSFDHRANGYARGEGFGVIVIKPLSAALQNGDTIRAVVRSTGTNQDGRTPGITQPSKDAQEHLIKETYQKAGLDMRVTRFFESHGTGTPLGDPIEASAIGAIFRNQHIGSDPLYIGALKSNIGHLEGASGVAGLIKAILVLERGLIPPNTNFESLNPKIDAHHLRLEFPTKAKPWPNDGLRRVSVNSFGFGGTNSHVVLDDAYNYLQEHALVGNHCTAQKPPEVASPLHRPISSTSPLRSATTSEPTSIRPKLLVWSAADERGLQRLATVYGEFFAEMLLQHKETGPYLERLAHTLAKRRSSLPWKSFIVTSSTHKLSKLKSELSNAVQSTIGRNLGFVFTGQGAQWPRMGRELLAFPVFSTSLHDAGLFLGRLGCSWSLLDELTKPDEQTQIHDAALSQPLCTALQVALVDLLRDFALFPTVVLGHSSGEIAAAYCIGAISRRSAWKLAYHRGFLASKFATKSHKRGAMLSVGLPEEKVHMYLSKFGLKDRQPDITVACINSPQSITLSGEEPCIDTLKVILDKDQIFARKLKVGVAYHSPQMSEIADDYAALIEDLEEGQLHCETIERMVMISTVTGDRISADILLRADYWVTNMISPVHFSQALARICSGTGKKIRKKIDGSHRKTFKVQDLFEIGPHSALQGPIRDVVKSIGRADAISYQSALIRERSGADTLLESLGRLYCTGHSIDVDSVNRPVTKPSDHPLVITNLPEYPFDHSRTHWTESRLSRSFRFRRAPRLDLLGTPEIDWNQHEAKWRHTIKASEMPWVEDHKVNGSVLYPAAGMLVMAIEAAKQLAKDNVHITGYEIKEAIFRNALVVPLNEAGIDTQFHIHSDTSDERPSWYRFHLYGHTNGDWIDICHGSVHVKYEEADTAVDNNKETSKFCEIYKALYETGYRACPILVDTQQMYRCLQQCGLDYGPAFRRLEAMACNDYMEAVGQLKPFTWNSEKDENPLQPHVIHPINLDSVFHLAFAAISKGGVERMPTMIPTKVNRLWVAESGLQSVNSVSLYSKVEPVGHHHEAFVLGLDSIDSSPRVVIEGLEATTISDKTAQSQSSDTPLCYNIDWKPDIDLLNEREVLEYCQGADGLPEEPTQFFRNLQLLVLVYILKTLESIGSRQQQDFEPHIRQYILWMRFQRDKFLSGTLPYSLPQWTSLLYDVEYQNRLDHEVAEASAQGKFYAEVGRNLISIIEGKIDPLALLFQGDLAKEYYQDIANSVTFAQPLARYLDALAHKNPGMSVLEVGAGTAGMTTHIITTLTRHGADEIGTPRYSEYTFTDISRSFFLSAQKLFKDQGTRMRFNALNIEDDPISQGFVEGKQDLVVAASVLHATKNLDNTVKNIRKLLKTGGKLLLLEVTKLDKLGCGFIFGLLPGWWQGDGYDRKWSPCVTKETWDEIALRNGFSRSELTLDDYEDEWCQETSIMVFTAIDKPQYETFDLPSATIMTLQDSPSQQELANRLQASLDTPRNWSCKIVTLREASYDTSLLGEFCVSLVDMDGPLLSHLDSNTYEAIQSTLNSGTNMLWLTRQSTVQQDPSLGIMNGLSRVLRTENPQLVFVTLTLEGNGTGPQEYVDTIMKVLTATLLRMKDLSFEQEYLQKGGILHIGRIIEANYLNRQVSSQLSPKQMKLQEFGESPPLTLSVGSPGLLDSLIFVEDKKAAVPLAANDIEVQVMAVGLNFMDLLVALGRVDTRTYMGGECAGIVTRSGEKADFKIGDRVAMMNLDTFKTLVRCPCQCAVLLPDDISFSVAAAIPTTFTTAYHSLYEVARMRTGESVLIHSAAGGTGQSAVQIAQHIGAEIYATVGSDEKKRLLMDSYKVPEDHIFYSRNTSFAQGVKRMTKGRGVDVILNSLSGDGLVASWECVAPYGRFVEIGKKDIMDGGKLPMLPFSKSVSFSAVDMSTLGEARPEHLRRMLEEIMGLVASGILHPPQPLQIYPISDVEKAFRHMQTGQSKGKLVLTVDRGDQVKTLLDTKPSFFFASDASFVIAGGLGGLGRSISRWMTARGARNLILLSRSGSRNELASSFVKELQDKGVHVATPACDITSASSLKSALLQCSQTMPPIKGCVQATAVLRDGIFERTTFENWKASVDPKVRGSWNLHTILPKGMDFFILLSSLCGIVGKETTANYAAGNSYMDALAHHRIQCGEPAASLDLGIMEEEGLLAENEDLMARMKAPGNLVPILSSQLHALLDYYCNPAQAPFTPLQCQAVVGVEAPANLRSKGIEPASWMYRPMFRHFFQMDKTSSSESGVDKAVDFATLFTTVGSLAEAGVLVADALMDKLSSSISIAKEDMNVNKPMYQYGVDSLVAIEIRNWFAKKLNADVAVFDILGDSTFAEIGVLGAGRSSYKQASWNDN